MGLLNLITYITYFSIKTDIKKEIKVVKVSNAKKRVDEGVISEQAIVEGVSIQFTPKK